jgi:prophage regulatory protein
MADAILRRPEVTRRTGRSRSAIYRGVAAGTFPAPVALGPRAVGWRESDIIEWIESLATKPARAA